MRLPKRPGAKSANAQPPAGGRARKRVEQFAIERGLELDVAKSAPAAPARKSPRKRGKSRPAKS